MMARGGKLVNGCADSLSQAPRSRPLAVFCAKARRTQVIFSQPIKKSFLSQ
jgi:ribosomal protein S27E